MSGKFETKYLVTHQGETLSLRDWAVKTGIDVQILRNRNHRGDTPETGLFRSYEKPVSKNDMELALNDLDFHALPVEFQKLIKDNNYKSNKYGDYIRDFHRGAFDKWFDEGHKF